MIRIFLYVYKANRNRLPWLARVVFAAEQAWNNRKSTRA